MIGAAMADDNRSTSALFKRAEQLRRWQESETNKQEVFENNRPRRVNFSDGCIFLAACAAGDKQEVLRLLEKGADIDTANVDGLTALHAACIDDNLDMVEFLVDQGTDVNRGDMEGWTPLHATASCGFNSIAKFLIDRGADLSLVNNDGDLAIDIADSDEMESLLQQEIETRGIDCDASRNREERRMLEDAQHWLGSGYLADRPHPKTGATALHVAAAKGYIKVMSLLIEASSDLNAKDLDGWTPLHAAAHWGQRDSVEILCENMADMDMRNFVGQSAFDVADSSLLRLMDELKRKQQALKLVNQNKQTPRKRKTSPHREHSNKKEREDQRESDGTSGDDESSSDVEKRNKVNKESSGPQIIPTGTEKSGGAARTQQQGSQARLTENNTFDQSEVQSWRRPSSLRKPTNNTTPEEKSQKDEVSRSISTPAQVTSREAEEPKRTTAATTTATTTTTTTTTASTPEKDESALRATRERLKARSCPALGQLEEEGGDVAHPHPSSHGSPSPLAASQRISSSDINLTSHSPSPFALSLLISRTGTPPSSVSQSVITSSSSQMPSVTIFTTPATPPHDAETLVSVTTATPTITVMSKPSNAGTIDTHTNATTSNTTINRNVFATTTATLTTTTTTLGTAPTSHRPLGPSLSNPVRPSAVPSTSPHLGFPPSSPPSSTAAAPPNPTALASLPTNHTTNNNNKDPRLLARSASLRERIQRNHLDSMVSSGSALPASTASTSPPARSVGRSFVPPSRDEESETQRKAHAKMVRSTRRSTQGVTLEDIKSAEQLMKNKQQLQNTSSPDSKESPAPASPSAKPKPDSPTRGEDEERRPSWRLKVDDTDKNRFSLENVRSKEKGEGEGDAETPTITVQLRKKNSEEKADEEKEGERNVQTREGTQAAIQRRKKSKRRSTGCIQVDMDEIDPEKRAQRQQQQQQQQEQQQQQQRKGEEGSEKDEEKDASASERGEAAKGSTSSLGSTLNSRTSSRSSIGPENGDLDYKRLYEEQLEENFRVHERLRGTENELRQAREAIDLNTKKCNTRLAMADADKREKRALERKLSEMEEELKQLRQENQRLKDENGALIRVISKLSK